MFISKQTGKKGDQFKIRLELDEDEVKHTAMKGPNAELFEDRNKGWEIARKEKNKAIDPLTDTRDIKNYLENFELPEYKELPESIKRLRIMYERALQVHGKVYQEDYKKYFEVLFE